MNIVFLGSLFLIFLVLKLTEYIDWSWVWVTSPLWGGFAFWVLFLIFFVVVSRLHRFNS